MSSEPRNGRNGNHKVGYIAVGFSKSENFWYSSEGVFDTPQNAIGDLMEFYPVNNAYAVKVNLNKLEGIIEE